MPLPTGNDLRPVDPVLTSFAIASGPDIANDYVADLAAPPVMTRVADGPTGTYFVWDPADMYRKEMKLLADGDPAPLGGNRVSTDTFSTKHYGLKTFLPDRVRDKAPSGVSVEQSKVYWLTAQAKANRDYLFQQAIFATSKWTSNAEQTGVAAGPGANQFLQWNDSSSTPLYDIQEQLLTVRLACGRMPNTIITNLDVLASLSQHSDFTGRVTGGGITSRPSLVDENVISKIIWGSFGMDGRIIIARAIHNTAAEGLTQTNADMFGKNMLIAYQDLGANPLFDQARPTAFASFSWSPYSGMTSTGATIKSWREEDPDGTYYRVLDDYVPKITMQTAAVFMASCVA